MTRASLIVGLWLCAAPTCSHGADAWADGSRCDAILAREAKEQSACERKGRCERFAHSGPTSNLDSYRACMISCAERRSPAYQACYFSLIGYARRKGLIAPTETPEGIAEDCFLEEMSITCNKDRVDDAKLLVGVFEPVLRLHGWRSSCWELQYLGGDAAEPDAIIVSLFGSAGERHPACRDPGLTQEIVWPRRKTDRALLSLADQLRDSLLAAPAAIRRKTLTGTGSVIVTDKRGTTAESSFADR